MYYFRVYENIVLGTWGDFPKWKKQNERLIDPFVTRFFINFEKEFYDKYFIDFTR